jgi:hypothetical protein
MNPSLNRRGPGSRIVLRLGLALAATVVSCLVVELIVRIALGQQPKFPRHVVGAPWGIRYNDPSSRYRHRSADVDVGFRINRNGMRSDRDFEHAKPAGRRRIVTLGDSFTIGYEVELEETFSSVLEARLRAAGLDVDVLNCGVSGFSNAEECLYLERELVNYEPDLVLVSYFDNDLDDNVRTGLFRIEGGKLVPAATRYVPAGGLGDYLNTSTLFSFLSEHSDAFVFVKESLTDLVKRERVVRNETTPGGASVPAAGADGSASVNPARPAADDANAAKRRLCALIFERILAWTRARGIPLVIQSIPAEVDIAGQLVDSFPTGEFDVHQPGLTFVAAVDLLRPLVGKERLYWRRSHHHWTPLAHRLAGEEMARRILKDGLLR